MDDKKLYHYLLLLLEDLNRDSFRFIKHICEIQVKEYDELIERFAKQIFTIPDDELKEFKQKIVAQKSERDVMQILVDGYLNEDFVRTQVEHAKTRIARAEDKK